MKYPKRNSKLWNYLNQNGFIDSKDDIIIQNAIKQYYKNYDRELKKRIRKVEKRNFTISFPTNHIQHIRKRAKEYGLSVVDFIKLIVLAELSNKSPLQLTVTFQEILQLLNYYKNTIDSIESRETTNWFGKSNYEELKKIIESIEYEIEIKSR